MLFPFVPWCILPPQSQRCFGIDSSWWVSRLDQRAETGLWGAQRWCRFLWAHHLCSCLLSSPCAPLGLWRWASWATGSCDGLGAAGGVTGVIWAPPYCFVSLCHFLGMLMSFYHLSQCLPWSIVLASKYIFFPPSATFCQFFNDAPFRWYSSLYPAVKMELFCLCSSQNHTSILCKSHRIPYNRFSVGCDLLNL